MLVVIAEAGSRPGGRGTCSLLRQRKVPKRKATPSLRPLRDAKGQTCIGAVAGCAVELTALRCSFVQTSTASQFTKHARFDARAHPATAPPQAQPAGGGTAEHSNSQTSNRAIAALGPNSRAHAQSAVQTGPSAAMARVDVLLPCPSGCAEERRVWRIRARVCLSDAQRRELSETPPNQSTAGCPVASAQGTQTAGSPFFWVLFFGETKKSTSPAGRLPASALKEGMPFDAHKPPRLSAHTRRMKPSISAGNLQPRRDGVHYKNHSCQGMKH